jgi:hypothetical protein
MSLRNRLALTLALAACALLPAAAQAGQRFGLGQGKSPHVVVDSDTGTAHVVWQQGDATMECNVPRGATSCTPQVVNMGLPADKPEPDTPWMLRAADGSLYIYMARYVRNDAYLSRSTDGGVIWSTGIPVYKGLPGKGPLAGTGITEPTLFPGGEVTIASFNGGGNVFAARLDGAEAGGGPVATLQDFGTRFKYDIQTVPTGDGGLITVAHDTPAYYWLMTPGADPSLDSSWGAPIQISPTADESRVASGPSGVYVLTVEPGGSFRHVLVRKLGATGFGAPVEAESETGYITDLEEGPSGTVAGAWRTNGSDPSNRLRFSTSSDGSVFNTVTITRGTEVFASLDVAIASDNKGFAVWEDDKDGIAMASTDAIVDEKAPPGTLITVLETLYGTLTLKSNAKSCVTAGASTTVTLGLKPNAKKGKITKTTFKPKPSGKKKTKALRVKLKIKGAKGSTVTVSVVVSIKPKKGKVKKKTVKVRIPVCA